MTHVTTERGLDRLVNFSDAVAAVAMTLLVLPLVELVGEDVTVDDLFSTYGSQLVTYVAVFLIMVSLWSSHHRFWELVVDYDHALMSMNALWLLLLTLFPVIAGFTFEVGLQDGQAIAYIALFALLLLVRVLMIVHVRSRRFMVNSDADPDDFAVRVHIQQLGIFAAAVGLIALWPDKVGWVLGFAFALAVGIGRLDRKRRVDRRTEPSAIDAIGDEGQI